MAEKVDFIDSYIIHETATNHERVNRHDIGDSPIVRELQRAEECYHWYATPNIKLKFIRIVCKTLRGQSNE